MLSPPFGHCLAYTAQRESRTTRLRTKKRQSTALLAFVIAMCLYCSCQVISLGGHSIFVTFFIWLIVYWRFILLATFSHQDFFWLALRCEIVIAQAFVESLASTVELLIVVDHKRSLKPGVNAAGV